MHTSVPDLGEGSVEEADGFVDVGLGRVEHGGEAEGVAVETAFADEQTVLAGALHDLRGGFGSRLFGLAIFHQFERLHQAHAAYVADERMLLLQLFELGAEVRANSVRVFEQLFFLDQFDGCFGGDAGDGISAESRDVRALEAARDFGSGYGEADRHSVGHALRARDHVRHDFPLLDAEPFLSGAAPACLHFVGDEERAVLLHDFENDFEILLGWSDEAADALNRLRDERGDVAAGAGLDEIFDVARASHFAIRIFQMQRAAVAVGIDRMGDPYANDAALAV